ncbi:MAG: hypothetical protein HC869_25740 [Rhodospirillales bacterium]|nr:hypothetical protein [Rhodospirillales bacterium]
MNPVVAALAREFKVCKVNTETHGFLAEPFAWAGKPVALSFAYGLHTFKKGETPDSAMATADKAMYASKRGKGSGGGA